MGNGLNHFYRLVWNHVHSCWVAVGETAKVRGKKQSGKLDLSSTDAENSIFPLTRERLLASFQSLTLSAFIGLTASTAALAAPQSGVIHQGQGQIEQLGKITTITQKSQHLGVNWQAFDIQADETVNFLQPGKTSIAINNILGSNGSEIHGQLNANGQVWLINPNGILFGQNSKVNVGGILASTLGEITRDGDDITFSKSTGSSGSIRNFGQITAAQDSYIAFVSEETSNQGSLLAEGGSVAMASGSQVKIRFAGQQLLNLNVEASTLDNLAENSGLIQADGGQVIMNAGAKDSLLASVVNNDGVIEARGINKKSGRILLLSGMAAGETYVAGILDASAADSGSDGGFIDTSGHDVKINDSARISTLSTDGKTGTWLIDPEDYVVGSEAGDNQTGAQLSASLATNAEVIVETQLSDDGDLIINDEVSWETGADLILKSANDIYINKSIKAAHGDAVVTLEYGQGGTQAADADYHIKLDAVIDVAAGNTFSSKFGTDDAVEYTVIATMEELQSLDEQANRSKNYALGSTLNKDWGNRNFTPIAMTGEAFSGNFEGLGHSIWFLTAVKPNDDNVGLFGQYNSESNRVSNLHFLNAYIKGTSNVGAVAGLVEEGDFKNVSASGGVFSANGENVGGLIGKYEGSGTISRSVGQMGIDTSSVAVGGLVGSMTGNGTIEESYTFRYATGKADVGGLVGRLTGEVKNSYSYTHVKKTNVDASAAGGLVGRVFSTPGQISKITHSFSSAPVTGGIEDNRGPLLGAKDNNETSLEITASYWVEDKTTGSSTNFGVGFSESDFEQLGTFSAWSIDDKGGTDSVWRIYSGKTLPLLRWRLTEKSLNQTVVYDGSEQTYNNPQGSPYSGLEITHKDVGTYSLEALKGEIDVGQTGFDYDDGIFVIEAKEITLTASKKYDKTDVFSLDSEEISVEGLIIGEDPNLGGDFLTKNGEVNASADAYDLDMTKVTLSNANYKLADDGHSAKINQQDVTISGSKTYDRSSVFSTDDLTLIGFVTGDTPTELTVASVNAGEYILESSVFSDANYVLAADQKLFITPKTISVSGSRVYDTSNEVKSEDFILSHAEADVIDIDDGLVYAEDTVKLTAGQTLTLSSANAGDYDNNNVTVGDASTLTLDASDDTSKNYTLDITNSADFKFTIDKKYLNVSGGRTYDQGDKVLNGVLAIADGATAADDGLFYEGEGVTLASGDIQLEAASAGSYDKGKLISKNLVLGGGGSANYQLNDDSEYDLTIEKQAVTISGSKAYDKDANFTFVELTVEGFLDGDDRFNDFDVSSPNAGAYALTDDSILANSNYTLAADQSIDITGLVITINGSKVYDQTSIFAFESLNITGLLTGDNLTGDLAVTSSDAGSYNLSSDNFAAGNYILAADQVLTITPRALTISGSKIYDQGSDFTFDQLTVTGLLDGDVVGTDFAVASANAGDYALNDVSFLANDNYTVAQNQTISITARDISVTGSKAYDKTTTFTAAQLTFAGLLTGDTLAAEFNVGSVDAGAYALTDNAILGNGNYAFADGQSITITPQELTLSGGREYNQTQDFTFDQLTVSGLAAGDTLTGGFSVNGSNVGSYIVDDTVTISDSNYTLAANQSVLITTKTLDLSGTKIYDGNTTVDTDALSITGILAGESVTVSGQTQAANKNTGQQSLDVTGLALDSSNYSLAGGSHQFSIDTKAIDVQLVVDDKNFDNNANATVSIIGSDGIVAGDQVVINFQSALFDALEGDSLNVTVSGFSLEGTDAANYLLNSNEIITTASIAAANPNNPAVDSVTSELAQEGATPAAQQPQQVNAAPAAADGSFVIDGQVFQATAAGGLGAPGIGCGGNVAGDQSASDGLDEWTKNTGAKVVNNGVQLFQGGCEVN